MSNYELFLIVIFRMTDASGNTFIVKTKENFLFFKEKAHTTHRMGEIEKN